MSRNQNADTFSNTRYYRNGRGSIVIDRIVLAVLILLILTTPLPFGSVGARSILAIQIAGATCFFLWLIKLFRCGNPEELARFRELHQNRMKMHERTPFFHRHFRLASFFRFLTLTKWPKRNPSSSAILVDTENQASLKFPFHSLFGYPVVNTGLERIALVFFILIVLQMIPVPNFLAGLVSPSSSDLYQSAARAAEIPLSFHPLSINSYTTFSTLLQYSCYFMFFLVTVNVIRTRSLYLAIVYAVIGSAIFQSVYGLYELFSGHQSIFWYKKKYFLNCATGTFINRNHYAAYVGLSLPLTMGLVANTFVHLKSAGEKKLVRILQMLETKGSQLLINLLFVGLVLGGIAFSLSLTGAAAAIVSSFFFLFLFIWIRKNSSMVWIIGLAVVAAAVIWIGSATFRSRIQEIPAEAISERSRFMAWKDTFRIFLHFPLIGTGAGTFSEIFPVYRTFGTTTDYSSTHNEYLQMLSENGILFSVLLLNAIGILLLRLRHFVSMGPSRRRTIQIGVFCSILVLGLHNLFDFSLEIPSVTVTGSVLAGLFFTNVGDENKNHSAS